MFIEMKNKDFIYKIFLFFILLQPLLDLLTGLSLRLTETQLSISLIVRALFLLLAGVYLFFVKGHPGQKKYMLYFTLFAVFLLINIGINYFEKPLFYIASEIKFIFKTIYFVFMLFLYWTIFRAVKEKGMNGALKLFALAVTIYGVIFFIAGITNTAFQSYTYQKLGHVGWFYASNEIGVILAMGLPIVLFMALKASNFYWISVFLVVYSLFSIGTKVGYLSIIFTLFLALVFVIKDYLSGKRRNNKDFSVYKIMVLLLFFAGSVLYTPFAPIAQNMDIHLSILETKKFEDIGKKEKEEESKQKKEDKELDSEEISELVYSGRTGFLEMYKEFYDKAPLSQKIFGMGYGGNFTKKPKLIEMDFHDIFYSFGIIGFLIYIFPLVYFIYKVIREFLNRFSNFLRYENMLILTPCLLGLAIAFMAGHVLTAPSVSYFLAILISLILVIYDGSKLNIHGE